MRKFIILFVTLIEKNDKDVYFIPKGIMYTYSII